MSRKSLLEAIAKGEVNAVGELLRGATFPAHNPDGDDWAIGAYTTFEVRPDAYPWSGEAVKAFFDGYAEDTVDGYGYSFDLDGLRVDLARFYEGDSVLAYAVWDGDDLVRAVENWDAKKNYVWREMEAGEAALFQNVRPLLPAVHLPNVDLDRSPRPRLSVLAEQVRASEAASEHEL